jgi:adenylate cyclase
MRIKLFLALLPFIFGFSLLTLFMETSGDRLSVFTVFRFLEQLNQSYTDFKMRLRPASLPNHPVVIVAFDERTLEGIGQWPPHRRLMAELLDRMLKQNPKGVALDIVFSEEERQFLTQEMIQALLAEQAYPTAFQLQVSQFFSDHGRKLSGDLALRDVIQSHASKVVLGYHWYGEDIASSLSAEQMETRVDSLMFNQIDQVQGLDYEAYDHALWHAYRRVNQNLPLFTEVAEHFGFFNAIPDVDGIYRQGIFVVSAVQADDTHLFFPSLGFKLALLATGSPSVVLNISNLGQGFFGMDSLFAGDQPFKVTRDGGAYLNYYGKSFTFPHVSALELIRGAGKLHVTHRTLSDPKPQVTSPAADSYFKDKLVLVGATAKGVYDIRPIPLEQVYPGVELHATFLDNILSQNFLKRPGEWALWISGFWLGVWLLLLIVTLLTPALGGFVGFLGLTVGLVVVDTLWVFMGQGLITHMVFPLMVNVIIFLVVTVVLYFFEGKDKAFLRNAFRKYVSPSVVDEIVSQKRGLVLGGVKREVSVLFSDIRGFTSISEKMDSENLSKLLSAYLTPMTQLVLDHRGTLDKYIGDAVMAFWGAPVKEEHHAHQAVICAIAMLRELKRLNQAWEHHKIGYPPIDIGIGINTGVVAVGNMGSESIFDYTVIGDAVNLASRIEGLNKSYGCHLMISEFTFAQLNPELFVFRVLDKVAVKGKKQGVLLYQVLGQTSDFSEQDHQHLLKWSRTYQTAFDAYGRQKWTEASQLFRTCQEMVPEDKASQWMLERIQSYQADKNLISEDWDGTFVLTSK